VIGGDSAEGNMTEALSIMLLDKGKPNIHAQILLYPESRVPFDTPAAEENNSGCYLECNKIFCFATITFLAHLKRCTLPAIDTSVLACKMLSS
jgi:alpha/beta hydrolase fold